MVIRPGLRRIFREYASLFVFKDAVCSVSACRGSHVARRFRSHHILWTTILRYAAISSVAISDCARIFNDFLFCIAECEQKIGRLCLFGCCIFGRQRHILFIHCIIVGKGRSHCRICYITGMRRVLYVTSIVMFWKKEVLSASSTIIISDPWCIIIILALFHMI